MVKVNNFIFFFASQYFLKALENMFFVFLLSYRNTSESLEELEKNYIYNSIETWYYFFFLNWYIYVVVKK